MRRHCLWILGNGETLLNSNSVWKKLVLDAKARGCFYNADEDKTMARALFFTLNELNKVDSLKPPPMFRIPTARWQVSWIFLFNFLLDTEFCLAVCLFNLT